MSILNSDSKLGAILKNLLNELKGDKLGENYIYWIDSVPSFDSPADNYEKLRKFLSDTKKFMETEIEYYKTYSPMVFHENAFKNVEAGHRLYGEIEKSL